MHPGHLSSDTAAGQSAHFDRIAGEYDDALPAHVMAHLLRRRVALATGLVPAGRVLDVGCGTGVFLAALDPRRYERVGVDVSPEMLAVAARRGVEVHAASADRLPLPDDAFDLVVTIATLHHLIEPAVVAGALAEIGRVLRPGGTAVVWDHNPLNPYWRILMARVPQDTGDERLVPAGEVTRGLRAAGLDPLPVRRLTFMPDFTPPRAVAGVAAAERILERVPGLRALGAHNVVVARKPGRPEA